MYKHFLINFKYIRCDIVRAIAVLFLAFTFISHAITSRSSRRKAPKNGTTGHSGIARARASARSYSEDRRAEERYSMTGMRSFTSCQNGFSLLDLQRKRNIRSRLDVTDILFRIYLRGKPLTTEIRALRFPSNARQYVRVLRKLP